jgi:hypothetical protein
MTDGTIGLRFKPGQPVKWLMDSLTATDKRWEEFNEGQWCHVGETLLKLKEEEEEQLIFEGVIEQPYWDVRSGEVERRLLSQDDMEVRGICFLAPEQVEAAPLSLTHHRKKHLTKCLTITQSQAPPRSPDRMALDEDATCERPETPTPEAASVQGFEQLALLDPHRIGDLYEDPFIQRSVLIDPAALPEVFPIPGMYAEDRRLQAKYRMIREREIEQSSPHEIWELALTILEKSVQGPGTIHWRDLHLAKTLLTWQKASEIERLASLRLSEFEISQRDATVAFHLYNLDPERVVGEDYVGEAPLPFPTDVDRGNWLAIRACEEITDADISLATQRNRRLRRFTLGQIKEAQVIRVWFKAKETEASVMTQVKKMGWGPGSARNILRDNLIRTRRNFCITAGRTSRCFFTIVKRVGPNPSDYRNEEEDPRNRQIVTRTGAAGHRSPGNPLPISQGSGTGVRALIARAPKGTLPSERSRMKHLHELERDVVFWNPSSASNFIIEMKLKDANGNKSWPIYAMIDLFCPVNMISKKKVEDTARQDPHYKVVI